MTFVKCPKCSTMTAVADPVTDGQAFTCPKCGAMTKAHTYRTYDTKLGPARAEPATGLPKVEAVAEPSEGDG